MSAEQSPTARLVVVYSSMTSSIILVPSKTILEQEVLCHSLILTNSVRISREQFFLFLRYIRLAQYCHVKIFPEGLYGILPIDQLLEEDFFRPISDVIHGSDPCHLILRFQLFIDTLFLCQLCYEQVEFVSCPGVNVSQVVVQSFVESETKIKHRTMFFQVLLMLSAPHTNRDCICFIRY